MPDRTCPTPLVLGADCLGGILNDCQATFVSHAHHSVHVGHLSVEMHWDDCARVVCDLRWDLGRIEVVGYRIYIDKNGGGAQTSNGANCCKECVRSGDDLIAGTDILGHETGKKSVAARRNSDCV